MKNRNIKKIKYSQFPPPLSPSKGGILRVLTQAPEPRKEKV